MPATTFTPRLAYAGPEPGAAASSAEPVRLAATASDGTPPYRFSWFSDRDGFLGEGASLQVPLTLGQQRIDVAVEDANGAGITASLLREVRGSAPPRAPAAALPVRAAADVPVVGDNGISFTAFQQEDRPVGMNTIRRGGVTRACNVYFGQFWYEIDFVVAGTTYTLKSAKCVGRRTRATDACALPKAPYAQSLGASAVTPSVVMAKVFGGVTTDNLPGSFRLFFEYVASNGY